LAFLAARSRSGLARRQGRGGTSLARSALRVGAATGLAAAFAVPLLRRRLRIPRAATIAATAAGPVALAVLRPRTRTRDAAVFALQMWAFAVVHELPYDDPEALRRRLRVRYPIAVDRAIGLGKLPNLRAQHAFSVPGEVTRRDRFLSFVHWVWFAQPHLALTSILVRRTERFPSAARQLAAVYDIGCLIYFLVPTAPPWWAGENGYIDDDVRRVMVEVGEDVWGPAWPPLYEALGGNPWAAMPSLHFATSLMAALLLAETGRVAGALGWSYALTLGFALVYLCEHYVVDLAAGAAIVALVRRGEPLVEPAALAFSGAVQRLERIANG
jgi:membrane-associated phospholipid phosphatase